MFKSSTAPWFPAALLTCIGSVGVLCPGLAQSARPHIPLAPQLPRPEQNNIVEHVFNIPGRGPVKMRFLRLPPSAVHRVPRQAGPISRFVTRGIITNTDSTLYSTETDFNGDSTPDPLWTFPTIGQDSSNLKPAPGVPNTLEANAPTNLNTADISYGMMGKPALITAIFADGGMAAINTNTNPFTFTPAAGDIFIVMFDGIDQNTAPLFGTNSAILQNLDSKGNKIDGYTAHFDATGADTSGFATWEFDMVDKDNSNTPNPYVINDPQGRFGLMIAKTTTTTTSPANVQWIGTVNSPHGPDDVYQIMPLPDGTFTAAARFFFPSDASFNQGAAQFGTYNYSFLLHGTNSDASAATVGTVLGNVRRRGVNVPAANTPEAAPGFYTLIATDSSGNVVRQDYFFTQPSYDADGNLIVNYKLEGYPTGTYNFELRQMPVEDSNGNIDIIWSTTLYPFGDFVPAVQNNVTISNGSTTTLSARLERLGDIADESGNPTPDGKVDFNDLNRLINAFNTKTGQDFFDPGADIVGDPALNPLGLPDGAVDFNDLNALIVEFNLGAFETTP